MSTFLLGYKEIQGLDGLAPTLINTIYIRMVQPRYNKGERLAMGGIATMDNGDTMELLDIDFDELELIVTATVRSQIRAARKILAELKK